MLFCIINVIIYLKFVYKRRDSKYITAKDNGERPQSQEEYTRRYNDLVERYNLKKKELDNLQAEKKRKKLQRSTLNAFIDNLKNEESIVSFDDKLWILLVDSATINRDGTVKFKFANGLEKTI